MTERAIRIAVARADLVLCAVLRRLPAVILLAALLLAAVILVRARLPDGSGSERDITSEGPEGDWTPAFYDWEDEENDMG